MVDTGGRAELETISLLIEGVGSDQDADLLRAKIRSLEGVKSLNIDMESRQATVAFDPSLTSEKEIIRSISETGMTCSIIKVKERSTWWKEKQQLALYGCGIIALFSFILMFLGVESHITNAIFGIAVLVGVYYPARKAIIALINLTPTIHLLMLIGASGAILLGMWYEAAILIFVYSLGDVLESYAVDKAREAIRSLTELVPKKALVRKDGHEVIMPTENIDVGDMVIVRPGERIPVDGIVFQGASFVDQAAVTGESIPVQKKIGDEVFAGTINQNGSIEVQVDRPASETMLSKIIYSVEEAQSKRTSYQRFSDNFAKWYTPAMFILGIAVATIPPLFFGADWHTFILRGLVVFVVSCSCGLALSVPVAIVAAMANAAQNGTVYKGGVYLEVVDEVKAVAFDKTGTLTIGRPEVSDILTSSDITEEELMDLTGSIESRSAHPLAAAIVRKAKEINAYSGRNVNDFQEISGMGVSANVDGKQYLIGNARLQLENGVLMSEFQEAIEELEGEGKTVVLVGSEGRLRGLIAIADTVRPGAKEALQRLKDAGILTVMLTGDNERSAKIIAQQVGADRYYGQLLPLEKVELIKELKAEYDTVAMVGDGINDAPAMAVSDVGIAMGAAGTDIAIEAGDVVLMSDDLSKLNYIRGLSNKTITIIRQNIWVSLINISFMVVAALLGYLGLVTGLLLNEASAIFVIFNALRLLRWSSNTNADMALSSDREVPVSVGAAD
ncbi:MAG: cation-translocating P-type ATPase [Euryarchaeota archaeon]|nr:cation-translocating P-type ATPase [Euryarchaeota archaeon]